MMSASAFFTGRHQVRRRPLEETSITALTTRTTASSENIPTTTSAPRPARPPALARHGVHPRPGRRTARHAPAPAGWPRRTFVPRSDRFRPITTTFMTSSPFEVSRRSNSSLAGSRVSRGGTGFASWVPEPHSPSRPADGPQTRSAASSLPWPGSSRPGARTPRRLVERLARLEPLGRLVVDPEFVLLSGHKRTPAPDDGLSIPRSPPRRDSSRLRSRR